VFALFAVSSLTEGVVPTRLPQHLRCYPRKRWVPKETLVNQITSNQEFEEWK